MTDTVIQIKNLTTILKGKQVHKHLNLDIKRGELLMIIGSSGAGKSVLFKNIIGLIKPSKGSITINDLDITKMPEKELTKVRRKLGVVFQGEALFDSLNVFENIAFRLKREGLYKNKQKLKNIVEEKLKLVDLNPNICDWMISDLSQGMKKRVGLARALALNVEIMLYDEPTTGLDPLMTTMVNDLIKNLQHQLNITSIVVTHDIESAFMIADRIAILHQEKILAIGSPREIQKIDNTYIQNFIKQD